MSSSSRTPADTAEAVVSAANDGKATTNDGKVTAKDGKPRQSARHGIMADAILEQAVALFADQGIQGTGIGEIAEAMGMSRPSVYHYFDSKDALLEQLLEGYTGDVTGFLRDVRNDSTLTAVEKVTAVVTGLAQRVAAKPAHLRLLAGSESSLPPALLKAHRDGRHESSEHVRAILIEGVEKGELRPADERIVALALFGMCHWIAWWYRPDGPATIDEIAAGVADLVLGGLVRPEARRQASGIHHAISLLREDMAYLERLVGANPSQR